MEYTNVYQHQTVAAEALPEERAGFLRKVYGLLALSIFAAALGSWFTLTNESFLVTVYRNQFLFFGLEIGAIFFCMWARKKENLGIIALLVFTVLTGITISPFLYSFPANVVAQAFSLTALTFIGLSVYTFKTKKDFSFLGGMLTTVLMVMVFGGLLNVFFFKSSAFSFLSSAVGVFLFSGFILYDTSNILRRYPTDEYVSATLTLYLDVLNLFMSILHIMGGRRD